MSATDQYELLDFGEGRKLERFGPHVLDRPSPAAEAACRADAEAWKRAAARYRRTGGDRGTWVPAEALPARWTITFRQSVFEIKPNEFGHVGLFPEQTDNWAWIARQVEQAGRALKVLNLFAYTGGSTLAAAAAGAEVVHVDAARNVVDWARRNAELSGLADAPIRWIAEDAAKFVLRELRRGNRYDAVILDPPTYGHGRRGELWQLSSGLAPLLASCRQVTGGRAAFLLVTCHTPGVGPNELADLLASAVPDEQPQRIESAELAIPACDGRPLASGIVARWSR